MKKILSIALATLMLATVFASCAPADQLDPAITLASSDASTYAEWLDERLDKIPDDVVIGVGSNEAYGIDMSNFESDGYIVREIDGDVLIFGATAEGTDRAVRVYAKAADINQTANLDETYHEGARIKFLTVAGRDISEFTIVHAEGDANLAKGASTLNTRLMEACGITLPISASAVSGAAIEFRWVTDEELKTVGFRWTVEEGKILLECSDGYKNAAPIHAVNRFLEIKLNWIGLTYGDYNLPAADHIDIPTGNGVEINTFNYVNLHGYQYHSWDPFDTVGTSYGPIPYSCHGMTNNRFAGELSASPNKKWQNDQPCYTSEEFHEVMKRDVAAYIDKQLAAGRVIGEDFFFVDVAHGDNENWCACPDCRELYRQEGNSRAAWILKWANRMSEELNSVPKYEGLTYGIFAYAGTERPPRKTVPNDLLYITYCFAGNCSNHTMDGSDCTTKIPVGYGSAFPIKDFNPTNEVFSTFLERWTNLTENIMVWYYAMSNCFLSHSFVHTVYEDINYFHDLGVKGIMLEAEDPGYGPGRMAKFMLSTLLWNIDEITPEVYEEKCHRVLETMYGDGWDNIEEYIAGLSDIYMASNCSSCWFQPTPVPHAYDIDLYAEEYDRFFRLLEEALLLTNDARQERRLIALQCYNIYNGSVSCYLPSYEAGDDEYCAELCARYSLINQRLSKYGIDMHRNIDPHSQNVYDPDLEIMMWGGTTPMYMKMWQDFEVTREMPERVAEYFESVAAEEATAE